MEMQEINKQKKKELKMFTITSKIECIVYLQNIIAIGVKGIEKYKSFLEELEGIVIGYKEGDRIPHDIYIASMSKLSNVECYLLNLFGDGQSSSISYFKFRKILEKLSKSDKSIQYYMLTDEEEEILKNFNLMRNWSNHIPESLLTSEIEMIRQGKALGHSQNPIIVNFNNYVTYEYINDLLITSTNFLKATKKLLQAAKKDYSLLIGEDVRIQKKYIDRPKDINDMVATKISAKVQGLPVDEKLE